MEVTKEMIRRYHLGECTAAELEAVNNWLESEHAELSYPGDFNETDDQQLGWEKLSKRYAFGESEKIEYSPVAKSHSFRFIGQIAASLILIMCLGLGYRLFKSNPKESMNLTYQTIQVNKGERKQVLLADGTQVWLNSESSLSFPKEFSGATRDVSFTGEAYFAVAKNPDKHFVINSPRTRTEVLGTRFNLRDYSGEEKSEVVVEEGKVRFSGLQSDGELMLTANQRGTFEAKTREIKQSIVYDSRKYMDWKENKLVLHDLKLEQIKTILERWYDIELIITRNDLKEERYTGSFNNPAVQEVLKSICFALKLTYHQQNKTFTITK